MPHLLYLGNPRKVKEHLSDLLDSAALDLIEREIERNTILLLTLANEHFRFAIRQPTRHWRQKVSRFYYSGYSAARALRLYIRGEYSTDVKDHQRFDRLPDEFPGRARYINQLTMLREDRNMCDYDHLSTLNDLAIGLRETRILVHEFINDTTQYLHNRGLRV